MKESRMCKALRAALYVVFVLGILGTVTLPWMLDTYMRILYDAYYLLPGYRRFILAFLMIVGAFSLWAVWEMIVMMRSIPSDPFIAGNVRALRRVGLILLVLAGLFLLKCLYYVTFLTMACGLMLILCGLLAFTLSNLFGQAVAYKEELDLTI